jgi:sulfur carrier protein
MKLTVNGEVRDSTAVTVAELCAAEGIDAARPGIAVAVNGAVVPRRSWAGAVLAENDRIEIVRALPGG